MSICRRESLRHRQTQPYSNRVSVNILPFNSTEPSRKYFLSKSNLFKAFPVARSTLRRVDSPYCPVVSIISPSRKKSPCVNEVLIVNIFLDNLNLVLTHLGVGARSGKQRQRSQRNFNENIFTNLLIIFSLRPRSQTPPAYHFFFSL